MGILGHLSDLVSKLDHGSRQVWNVYFRVFWGSTSIMSCVFINYTYLQIYCQMKHIWSYQTSWPWKKQCPIRNRIVFFCHQGFRCEVGEPPFDVRFNSEVVSAFIIFWLRKEKEEFRTPIKKPLQVQGMTLTPSHKSSLLRSQKLSI